MSSKAVRVRSSALLNPLKYAGFSKIQEAAALSPGALDTTELLGEGLCISSAVFHAIEGVHCSADFPPDTRPAADQGGMMGSQ